MLFTFNRRFQMKRYAMGRRWLALLVAITVMVYAGQGFAEDKPKQE